MKSQMITNAVENLEIQDKATHEKFLYEALDSIYLNFKGNGSLPVIL